MKRIGERIKGRRVLLNLHLNELAGKVGISSSALSQIEKAKAFPSIITLKSIADNLNTTVGFLIGENDNLSNNPVIKKSEVRFVQKNSSGTELYLLSQHDISKQMDTYLVRLIKESDLSDLFPATFGQTYCHVLSGEVDFQLDDKRFIVKQGDNIYFNCKSGYQVKNCKKHIAELLWIISSPNF
jgi:transcriptional regulator with XRE-family HTH domain